MTYMKQGMMTVFCALLALFFYGGCSAPLEEKPVVQVPTTHILHEHVVQSKDLRFLMRSMNEVVHEETEQSALESDDARRRYALRLAGTIEEIAGEIERYPIEEDVLETPQDVAQFKAYATELFARGERIHQIAVAYEMEKLDPAINQMVRTCNACHRHFDAHATRVKRGER